MSGSARRSRTCRSCRHSGPPDSVLQRGKHYYCLRCLPTRSERSAAKPSCRECGSRDVPRWRTESRLHVCTTCLPSGYRCHDSSRGPRKCRVCGISEDGSAPFAVNKNLCRECAGAMKRKYRLAHPEKYKIYAKRAFENKKSKPDWKLKSGARRALRAAVYSGRIQPLPCIFCGDAKSHGHHEDYNRPYDVHWLCAQHHVHVHAGRICLLPL